MPVTLPPGRLMLATRPLLTGSAMVVNTIGTVSVTFCAAMAETGPPAATITPACMPHQFGGKAGQPIVFVVCGSGIRSLTF